MTSPTAMAAPHSSITERKRAARLAARAILERCDPATGALVAWRIGRHLPAGIVVAGFYPFGREINVIGTLRQLWAAGPTVIALPRTPASGQPLTFHRWSEDDSLVRERFGTMTSDGPEVSPDVLLVPLLAFDRCGHRLGYGGGFYDRTIAARPQIWTIGCAYAALEVPAVPTEPTDMPLHAIATEAEFITVRPHPLAATV